MQTRTRYLRHFRRSADMLNPRDALRVAACAHAEDRLCWDCYQQALAAEREACARLAECCGWPAGPEVALAIRSRRVSHAS